MLQRLLYIYKLYSAYAMKHCADFYAFSHMCFHFNYTLFFYIISHLLQFLLGDFCSDLTRVRCANALEQTKYS